MDGLKTIILLLISLSILLPVQGQELAGVEKKVKRYVRWMVREQRPDVWGGAQRLQELGSEAVPIIKRMVRDLPGMAKVGCAKALIDLGEFDYSLDLLVEIVEREPEQEVRLCAIQLLGAVGDFELESRLEKILEETFDPYVKIALAKVLWQIARNPKAPDILKSFLKVDNVKLQYEAALALGEIQNVRAAKPILSKLKDEPTERGKLARVFLEYEAKMANFERLLDSQGGPRKEQKDSVKYPVIDEVIEKVQEYHVNGDKIGRLEMVNAAIKGIVSITDPHSAFWTEKEWDDFVNSMINEEYVGIGIYVGERDGRFTVISPVYSGPAYRAGIRSMDRIVEVNGWSTMGKPVDEIIKRIKGDTGTSVKLKIQREGWSKVREIEVKREKIRVPSLFFAMLPEKIGYIRLTQFGSKATSDIEKALSTLESQGMQALALDLRGNAGGWLPMAVEIVDKFIDAGKLIVYSEGRHPKKGKRFEYHSTSSTHPNYPMVLLVDQSSASASEIVAGALKHYQRATLIGVQTYGKGSVQEPMELDSRRGARLKLTIARYFLPDGTCIHNDVDKDGTITKHNGILPNIEVKYEDWESWKNEEYGRLQEENAFERYLDQHFEKNRELFIRLADNDQLSIESYPGFADWYKSLNTRASEQDIRYWLRSKVRRRVSDIKGKEYACDYLEDNMLQRGIIELCRKLGTDAKKISEYQAFADKFDK